MGKNVGGVNNAWLASIPAFLHWVKKYLAQGIQGFLQKQQENTRPLETQSGTKVFYSHQNQNQFYYQLHLHIQGICFGILKTVS